MTRQVNLDRRLVGWLGLALGVGACFGGDFAQGLPCTGDADCGPQLRCQKQVGQTEGLCGGQGDAALCGNGLRDAGEDCDDGDLADGDDCTPECRAPVCGDGFLAPGEGCDDGNTADGDGCTNNCMPPADCGDGVVDAGETCDDGNTVDGDACTPACRLPVCGDGFLGPGEPCDDGNDVGTDECTPTCSLPACNDGYVNGDDACDDGNAVDNDDCTTVCTLSPEVPTFALSLAQVKQFEFTWASRGAEYYQLFERAEPGQEFLRLGDDLLGDSYSLTAPLLFRTHASYMLKACNGVRCAESKVLDVSGTLAEAVGYFKASNTAASSMFGESVALSGDGETLAVGAIWEGSVGPGAGAVYVFVQNLGVWSQQAFIKASNADDWDQFGASVALSADGSTLAVGATGEGSQAVFDPDDNSAPQAGAVYVFERGLDHWSQQVYIKAPNAGAGDLFGASVALSADGGTLAVGAFREASQATGIDNAQDDDSAPDAGAVYLFTEDTFWAEPTYIKASNTDEGDAFGYRVALSGDGDTLVVGAYGEDSQATGIDNDQADDASPYAGAAYVFVRNLGTWSQQAYLKASNTDEGDVFGWSVAMSEDGDTLAVGAQGESDSGAVYVFVRTGGIWSQQAHVKASDTDTGDGFGRSVALSGDGAILVVGAPGEDSFAAGINGDPDDGSATSSGAGYLFVRSEEAWAQRAYVKASAPGPDYNVGSSIALSIDGETLAIGSPSERGAGTGIGASPGDDSAPYAGAIYLY